MYKVLWFDDEFETLENIVEDCLLEDIQLIGYGNSEEGLKALNEDQYRFDAVLLDGMFFKTPNQSGDVNDSAFGEVAVALGQLKAKGIILPWFIYSGQKNFVKDKNKLVDILADQAYANGKVFDKNNDQDFIQLCAEIKKAADMQPLTQARHKNPELMEIFERGFLPESVEENVMDLLMNPLPSSNTELKSILTNVRSVQESCLVKLESLRVVDRSLRSFNQKMNHLSGNPSKANNWEPTTEVYHTREIKNLQEWIYYTCSEYLHYLDNQHNDVYMISNYAVESLRQGLFEILLWFKKTYEENI
ncbi:hypothetical protein [Gelidibacter japonicus]|uniref:hypothetical protein n=1 Tax=Gelidibacter japonicus TaxID=1962232 RepID=UPI003A8CE326